MASEIRPDLSGSAVAVAFDAPRAKIFETGESIESCVGAEKGRPSLARAQISVLTSHPRTTAIMLSTFPPNPRSHLCASWVLVNASFQQDRQ